MSFQLDGNRSLYFFTLITMSPRSEETYRFYYDDNDDDDVEDRGRNIKIYIKEN